MITTTIDALLTAKPLLQKLANTAMPAKDAFAVLRVLKVVEKEYETIGSTQRGLVEKYGVADGEGSFKIDDNGNYLIKPELIEDYMAETKEFLGTKVEIESSKLSLDILSRLEVLTPAQLMMMEDFIDG